MAEKRRSRSISPEPRIRLDRSMRSLRNLLVSRRPARVDQEQDGAETADEPEGRPPARPFAEEAPIVGASEGAMFWPSEIQLMTSGISLNV